MQPNNPLSLLTPSLAPTKANAEMIGQKIAAACDDGDISTLDAVSRLHFFAKAVESAIELTKDAAKLELKKYPKEGATVNGVLIELVETGVKYDYSADAQWRGLNDLVKEANANLRAREAFLKGIKKAFDVVDKETGEVTTIYPPVRTSGDGPKVTIPKGDPVIVAEYDPTVNATIIS